MSVPDSAVVADLLESVMATGTVTVDIPGVEVEVVDAAVCGRAGCHERDPLLRAEIADEYPKTLCPPCLARYLRRENYI